MKTTNKSLVILLFILLLVLEAIGQIDVVPELLRKTESQNHTFIGNNAHQNNSNRSRYLIPRKAYSIDADDIDLDGDNDIVVGHNFSFKTQWSGVSILLNNGFGYFELYDSVYLYGGQSDVRILNLNNESSLEIAAKYIDTEQENEFIAIINDFNFVDISYYSLNTFEGIGYKTSGDVNGDANVDVVVASNDGQFWGVLYNNGFGQLSQPYYQNVYGYYPSALACGDLNEDGRDDVVVCGQSTEVYFSYPGGFESLLLEDSDFKEGAFVTDFDLDGDNDLLTFVGIPIINISALKMFENQGGGILDTLGIFYFHGLSSESFLSDFNNDSLPDALFTLTDNSGLVLFYNQGNFQMGDSTFISLPGYPNEGSRQCSCVDFDGNGFNDIAMTRGASIALPDNLVILFNDGEGNFGEDPIVNIHQLHRNTPNFQCYPNPFSYKTNFEIDLINQRDDVCVKLYSIKGRLIRNWNVTNKSACNNSLIQWDGSNSLGESCTPGIYIATLEINKEVCKQIKILKHN